MNALILQNVSKMYRLYDKPQHKLKEALLRSFFRTGKAYHREFWALKDINIEISRGATIGIIGKNGSGKSTLLQIISGILQPTGGEVKINGRISALLELGTGFNPEFTGIENIILQGAIMGFSKREMEKRLDEIADFADIGDFINHQVKIYSSGMYIRLAFSTAINVNPDIFIIDEAMAVGDARFQRKCFAKLEDFRRSGKTIIIVSHDMASIVNISDLVIWLANGQVLKIGNPKDVVEDYLSAMYEDIHNDKGVSKIDTNYLNLSPDSSKWIVIDDSYKSFGLGGAKLVAIAMVTNGKEATSVVYGGDEVHIIIEVKAFTNIEDPIFGFQVCDKIGNVIFGINSDMIKSQLQRMEAGKLYFVRFKFTWPYLAPGYYSISPAIANGNQEDHVMHHWIYDVLIIQSLQRIKVAGLIGIPDASISFMKEDNFSVVKDHV